MAFSVIEHKKKKKKKKRKKRKEKKERKANQISKQRNGTRSNFLVLFSGYLGYVQRIRPGESPSVQDFHRGDLIEGYLDYLKVGIKVVLERCTSSEGNFNSSWVFFLGMMGA